MNMIDAAASVAIPRYFYSSSVCVYRDMVPGEPELTEDDAYPAQPDNEIWLEKLYAERVVRAYANRFGMPARIARFQNCYGPFGTWCGRQKRRPRRQSAARSQKQTIRRNDRDLRRWHRGPIFHLRERHGLTLDPRTDGVRLQ